MLICYHYSACDVHGHIIKGKLEALHETDLEARLKNLGLILLRAAPHKTRVRIGKPLSAQETINFLFQLELQLRSGIPIRTALADLRAEALHHNEPPQARRLAASLLSSIESGATLAEAMQSQPAMFSSVTCCLVRAGEAAGQLPEVLAELVRSMKWQDEMLGKTRKLLIYPLFVAIVIFAVVLFLMIYLLPQLASFLYNMGGELPLQTRVLMTLSRLFVEYWWALLALPIISIGTLAWLIRRHPGLRYRLHQAALRAPYLGSIIQKSILARLADTFALMYRTGIPVLDAITYCRQITTNLVIQQAIVRAGERIASGETISSSFAAERIFPSLVVRMLKVGETTGALDTALGNINYFYHRDIEESIAKAQAMIEPAMSITMGLLLGWIMLSVFSPLYDTIASLRI